MWFYSVCYFLIKIFSNLGSMFPSMGTGLGGTGLGQGVLLDIIIIPLSLYYDK